MLWHVIHSQATPALAEALSAAVMGPSSKVADPRQVLPASIVLIVASHLDPRVLVGPEYLTTAEDREPSTQEPFHLNEVITAQPSQRGG